MDRDDSRDPDAPPTAEEAAAAAALRDALERSPEAPARAGSTSADVAAFARAVALAHRPRVIDEDENRTLVAAAIARGEARRARSRTRWGRVATFSTVGLALAAAFALVVGRPTTREMAAAPAAAAAIEPLVPVRSTQPLFPAPFARNGGESARIDRIASARAADLRDNRFAAWGVR